MSNPSPPRFHSTSRAMIILLFSVCILLAVFALPPRSGAVRQQAQQPNASGKRTRPEFVRGEVLVRYRNEDVAKSESIRTRALRVEGKSMSIQIERFQGFEYCSWLAAGKGGG